MVVELLSILYLFNPTNPPVAELNARAPRAPVAAPADAKKGFTIKLKVDLDKLSGEKPLLNIPGVVSLVFRDANADKAENGRQNYWNFAMPDGSIPILESVLLLHSRHARWKRMPIGVPLKLLKDKGLKGVHEIVLNFSGAHFRLYIDGELMDRDFPFGYPKWERNPVQASINPACVTSAAIYAPAITPVQKKKTPVETVKNIQYWTPKGHNAWAGDVATLYHDGRFHVFYLYDRRHHRSRFGTGAHYFEHLSTKDFKHWVEHEAAVPIDEQCESVGTGTPFVYKGKIHISYGLHTTRLYPDNQTVTPAQVAALRKNGKTSAFVRAKTKGVPSGSTYSVSEDGVKFTKSQIMFHPCENPSVYIDPDGKLKMLAGNRHGGGTWASDALDGGWHRVSGFPPGGDCTFFFRWGKYDYIIGGFRNFWNKPVGKSDYVNLVAKGLDCYDGLGVPAITVINNNRCLMTGWTARMGWGGHLVLRELVQFPDGRLGSKWMKEVTPETGRAKTVAKKITAETVVPTDGKSSLLTFDVHAADMKAGRFAVGFFSENEKLGPSDFQLSLTDARAQWNDGRPNGFAATNMKSVREGGPTNRTGNYAIEKLIGVDRPFQVRLLLKDDSKIGGTLIDAEIAGSRTMVTCRIALRIRKMIFRTEGVELRNVKIAPLK